MPLTAGIVESSGSLENSVEASHKIKHKLTLWPTDPTPGDVPQGEENVCPHKKLFMNVYSGFYS